MTGPFSPIQLRVLGALAEKAATVPDTYPMTLKGLATACNQKNSRDPVTNYDEHALRVTLDELKALGVVRFVHASHGARSTKFRHILDERLGLGSAGLAVLSVLFLRGPQTVSEIRTRTERAHRFSDAEATEDELARLASLDPPLVVHLPRQVGQSQTRWMHLLGEGDPVADDAARRDDTGGPDFDAPVAAREPAMSRDAGPTNTLTSGTAVDSELSDRVAALEARVAALEALLAD